MINQSASELISYSGLAIALLLPWMVGVVWVRLLLLRTSRKNEWIIIGFGYFVGIFLTTGLLRVSNGLGLGLDFKLIVMTLSVLLLLGIALAWFRPSTKKLSPKQDPLRHWQIAILAMLLMLIGWRYLTLLQELLLRPLYAWDAWMNWAPKAIVWFQLGELVEYVAAEQWLQQGPESTLYTLGNRRASEYPPAVPLVMLWSMMGANTWDHSALFLPWILAAANLGLALYGQLRLSGCSALSAVIACYLLLNLPYYNVHTVLAGYADIWLAATFALAIFGLHEWHASGSRQFALLYILMAVMCSQLKVPGIVLTLILLATGLRALLNPSAKSELVAVSSLVAVLTVIFLLGLDIEIPGVGRLAFSAQLLAFPGVGEFALDYHPVWWAFWQSMFVMTNWNIAYYVVLAVGVVAVVRGRVFVQPSPEALAISGAVVFVVSSFIFTEHYKAAENFVTINRALLYTIPAMLFYFSLKLSNTGHRSRPSSPVGR